MSIDLGYKVAEASYTASVPAANQKYARRFQSSSTATLTHLGCYGMSAINGGKYRLMLYSDNSGEPDALLAYTNDVTVDGAAPGTNYYSARITSPVSGYTLSSGTWYWIAIHVDTTFSRLYKNASSGGTVRYNSDTFSDGPSDPFGSTSTATDTYVLFGGTADNDNLFSSLGDMSRGGELLVDSTGETWFLTYDSGFTAYTLYRHIHDGGEVVWTTTTSGVHGTGVSVGWLAACLDSNDDIHCVFSSGTEASTRDVAYAKFDTSTGLMGSWGECYSYTETGPSTQAGVSIDVDSNNYPYVAGVDMVKITGGTTAQIVYSHNVGSGWITAETVNTVVAKFDHQVYPKILVNTSTSITVSWHDTTNQNGYSRTRTSGTWGSANTRASMGYYYGNWMTWDGTNIRYTGAMWSTTDIYEGTSLSGASDTGYNIYSSIYPQGMYATYYDGVRYVFYIDSTRDTHLISYDTSWTDEGTLDTGTFTTICSAHQKLNQDIGVNGWIPYVYTDGYDHYFGKFDLDTTTYVNFTVLGAGAASTGAIELAVSRLFTILGAGAASTAAVELAVTRLFTILGAGTLSTSSIALEIVKFFDIIANGTSSTSDIELAVERLFTIAGGSTSSTTAIEAAITRFFTIAANGNLTTSDIAVAVSAIVEFIVSSAGVSSTSSISLEIIKLFTILANAVSTTGPIELGLEIPFSVSGAGVSSTSSIEAAIERLFTIAASGSANTTAIELGLELLFTVLGAATSSTTAISVDIIKLFTILANAVASTGPIELAVERTFTIAGAAVASTSDIEAAIERAFSIAAAGTSSTTAIALGLEVLFTISGAGVSSTSDIGVDIVKLFQILANAVSSTTGIAVDVTREFNITGAGTVDTGAINVALEIPFTIQANAASQTSAIALGIEILFQILGQATASTGDINVQIVKLFQVLANAASTTSDVALTLAKDFSIQGGAIASTASVELAVERLFQILGQGTADTGQLELAVERLFQISGEGQSQTSDITLWFLNMLVGLLTATRTSSAPGVEFVGTKPDTTFSGRQ